jgi:hypothetical protein
MTRRPRPRRRLAQSRAARRRRGRHVAPPERPPATPILDRIEGDAPFAPSSYEDLDDDPRDELDVVPD